MPQQFTQEGVLTNPGTHGNIDRPWLYGPRLWRHYYTLTHLPYLGALKTGPVTVGIDGRGDTLRLSAYNSTFDRQDGLFSIRVASKNKIKSVTPYIQGGFGIAHTKVPGRTYYSNNFIYQFSVGVDKKIQKHIDWRIVEASASLHHAKLRHRLLSDWSRPQPEQLPGHAGYRLRIPLQIVHRNLPVPPFQVATLKGWSASPSNLPLLPVA